MAIQPLASPSTIAYIMAQKYVDNPPLARQKKMWAREGIFPSAVPPWQTGRSSAALIQHQVRLFEYQPNRSGKRPEAFLKDFTGALVPDGYLMAITSLPRSPIVAAEPTSDGNGGRPCRRVLP